MQGDFVILTLRLMVPARIKTPAVENADWRSTIPAGAGGLAWAAAILLVLAARASFIYHPYAGVVGLPAVLNYPPQQELFFYAFGLAILLLGGWAGWAIGSSAGRRAAIAILVTGIGAFALAVSRGQSQGAALVQHVFQSSPAAVQFMILALVALPLLWPQRQIPLYGTRDRGFSSWACGFGPIWFHVSLVLIAFLPWWQAALGLAAGIAYVQRGLLDEPERPWKGRHVLVWLETLAWFALAAAPALAWFFRLRLSLDKPVPDERSMALIALIVISAPILIGWLRSRGRLRPWVTPAGLMPFSVLALLSLASAMQTGYDAFHMGEFEYPPLALARGLKPWRDIFYVHGFGIDTVLGALAGRPDPRIYGIANQIAGILAGVATALGTWWMNRLLGPRWWLMTLMLGCVAFGASAGPSSRYVPMWLVLLAVTHALHTGRMRWLSAAGAIAWLGAFYSLDIGSTLLAALGIWTLLWGYFGAQRWSVRIQPLASFMLGVAVVAIPTLIAMAAIGVLDDFFKVNWQYLLIKRHYDKIPLVLGSMAVFVSPVATICGAWAGARILGRRERTPLAGMIVLLAIVAPLVFLRALDRADFGHLIYATIPAWPLLGCLVAWRAIRGEPIRVGQALGRSALVCILLAAWPYTHQLLSRQPGGAAMIYPVGLCADLYARNSNQPLVGPVADPESAAFFELIADLDRIIKTGQEIYDFSNQPALYAWSGRICPTRFFTAFYAAGEIWQDEVTRQLDRRRVRWILWRGPNDYWNQPDAIPNCVRQWKIARFILSHYRPAHALAGGSLLLERVDDRHEITRPQPYPELWLKPAGGVLDLKKLPFVWGANASGVPPKPNRIMERFDSRAQAGGHYTWPVETPEILLRATDLWAYVPAGTRGRMRIRFGGSFPPIQFDLDPGYAGPYRVLLVNLPHWIWGDPPAQIESAIDPPTNAQVKLEFRR